MAEPASADAPERDVKLTRVRSRWREIAARVVFVGAAIAGVTLLTPAIPREQVLVFRLAEPTRVRSLQASWRRVGDEAPRGGVTLQFPDAAPRRIEHRASIANGVYELDVAIGVAADADDERPQTTYHRRVELEGGVTTIRLDPEEP
jgi:hypothetical protein